MADGTQAEVKNGRRARRPEMMAPMEVSSDRKQLLDQALEWVQVCRASVGMRASYYRQLNALVETGRQDGTRSKVNKLHAHCERKASNFFSPTGLRFIVESEYLYPKQYISRMDFAARLLTRIWARRNIDMTFGLGVFEALKYGAAFLKQWVQYDGAMPVYHHDLVLPWQIGVYNEAVNTLERQSVICHTMLLTMPEVWMRIAHLPDAKDLMRRIMATATAGSGADDYASTFHQILSTSVLNTSGLANARPMPGGIVNLQNSPSYAVLGPEVEAPVVRFHELWVQEENDYTTIQLVEPNILVAPLLRKTNLLAPGLGTNSGLQPFTLIQPNPVKGYIYGRTEIADLIEPQTLLSMWADDADRLFGLQVDKIIGFMGFDGLTDENYDQRRQAGFFNGPPGSQITDLTPQFPPQTLEMIKFAMTVIDHIGGFDNILDGSGAPGVRSGDQTNALAKLASPRLRDCSLRVERQAAEGADTTLSLMELKDPRNYWTDGKDDATRAASEFKLADLPSDRQVAVDSHSTSPIFIDDHANLIWNGVKTGIVDGHSAIDDLPFPHKDRLHADLTAKEERQAAMIKQLFQADPAAAAKVMAGVKRK